MTGAARILLAISLALAIRSSVGEDLEARGSNPDQERIRPSVSSPLIGLKQETAKEGGKTLLAPGVRFPHAAWQVKAKEDATGLIQSVVPSLDNAISSNVVTRSGSSQRSPVQPASPVNEVVKEFQDNGARASIQEVPSLRANGSQLSPELVQTIVGDSQSSPKKPPFARAQSSRVASETSEQVSTGKSVRTPKGSSNAAGPPLPANEGVLNPRNHSVSALGDSSQRRQQPNTSVASEEHQATEPDPKSQEKPQTQASSQSQEQMQSGEQSQVQDLPQSPGKSPRGLLRKESHRHKHRNLTAAERARFGPSSPPNQGQGPRSGSRPFLQWKKGQNLYATLPLIEVPNPPTQFPVTLPNVSDAEWHQYHVTGTPKLITMFSGECNPYFDWQTLGLFYSFKRSGQPGRFLRLLACSESSLPEYQGLDLCPTLVAPSWNVNPRTGDLYSAINKPVGVYHWLEHGGETLDSDWVLILDADQILRAPIVPWELGAESGRVVAAPYTYLIGCDNILGNLHLKRNKKTCDKVGGILGMTLGDIQALAPWWVNKTEEVRGDKAHYATNITGDVYGQGWISEMYGYSFGASEVGLKHVVNQEMMLYPGYIPAQRVDPRLLHYGLAFKVMNWSWAKFGHRADVVFKCGAHFSDPPDVTELPETLTFDERRRDLISMELVAVLNRALREHHRRIGCDPKEERDVGIMDLNGGGLSPSGAPWVDVWLGKASARAQETLISQLNESAGIEEREGVLEQHALGGELGNKHLEMVGVEKGLYVENEAGSYPVTRGDVKKPSAQKKQEASPSGHPAQSPSSEKDSLQGPSKREPDQRESPSTVNSSSSSSLQDRHRKHLEQRRALFRSATAERLFADFSSAAAVAESSHMAVLLSFSVGLVLGLLLLMVATRMLFRRRRKATKKAHRLKRDGVRKARLLDM